MKRQHEFKWTTGQKGERLELARTLAVPLSALALGPLYGGS